MSGRKSGRGRRWQIAQFYSETLEQALLVGTNVFPDSEFGQNLRNRFRAGDFVRVTIERIGGPRKPAKGAKR